MYSCKNYIEKGEVCTGKHCVDFIFAEEIVEASFDSGRSQLKSLWHLMTSINNSSHYDYFPMVVRPLFLESIPPSQILLLGWCKRWFKVLKIIVKTAITFSPT